TPGVFTSSVGTPTPDITQGDHWLSQVPESPLCMHAPLSDPGGVLDTPLGASRRDRTAARTTLGGEFPALALSICKVGASFHHGLRFRRPPLSSRTVGFPEYGWRPWLSPLGLPMTTEAYMLTHLPPSPPWFAPWLDTLRR